MKFKILCLFLGLFCYSSCNQDKNPTFKGGYSLVGNLPMFISCDGAILNIKEKGEAYEKLKNRYIAFEMKGKPVMVTVKANVLKSVKMKNDKELKDIEITSLIDIEIGKNCAGENVNY